MKTLIVSISANDQHALRLQFGLGLTQGFSKLEKLFDQLLDSYVTKELWENLFHQFSQEYKDKIVNNESSQQEKEQLINRLSKFKKKLQKVMVTV